MAISSHVKLWNIIVQQIIFFQGLKNFADMRCILCCSVHRAFLLSFVVTNDFLSRHIRNDIHYVESTPSPSLASEQP